MKYRQKIKRKCLCSSLIQRHATSYSHTPLWPPAKPHCSSRQSFYINELGYGQRARSTGPAQPAVGRPENISRPTATRQAWLCRPGQNTLSAAVWPQFLMQSCCLHLSPTCTKLPYHILTLIIAFDIAASPLCSHF